MLKTHEESGADVTIAAKPVDRSTASSLGVMRVDDSGRVVGFLEKPRTATELDDVAMEPAWIDGHGVPSNGRDCLASMGIYLFRRDTLVDALVKTNYQDFGREVFPASIRARRVQLHLFDGYWEDIGTIGSFYDANLELTKPNPPFELASPLAPIYSRPRFLPPTRVDGATITQSLVADGSIIEPGAVIENSVIGLRCRIGRNVLIRNSVIMGNDYYETPVEASRQSVFAAPPIGIGEGTVIEGALVDKNCRIGAAARVIGDRRHEELAVDENCIFRDGILVVSKDSVIPDRWTA
jgi:glucose-1-phosphate adenylyltransferase